MLGSRHDVQMIDPVFAIPAIGSAHVQVTATGEWHKAARLADRAAAERFLAEVAEGPPEALAMELFWPGPPISFIGVVLDDERVRTLPDLVDTLTDQPDAADAALTAMTGGKLGPLASTQCGAINAWTLVPPMTLWDGTTWREPKTELPAHPDLRVCDYPVGLEVGHEHAWYAVEVSRRAGSRHIVDEARLDELAGAIRRHID